MNNDRISARQFALVLAIAAVLGFATFVLVRELIALGIVIGGPL